MRGAALLVATASAFVVPGAHLPKVRQQRVAPCQSTLSEMMWASVAPIPGQALSTLVAWAVPTLVIALGFAFLNRMTTDKNAYDIKKAAREFGLDSGAKKKRSPLKPSFWGGGGGGDDEGGENEPPNKGWAKSMLKVERLNAQLDSYEFDLARASKGLATAKRERRRRRLELAFGDELGLSQLSDDALDALKKAEETFNNEITEAREDLVKARAEAREAACSGVKNVNVDAVADATEKSEKAEVAFIKAIHKALPTEDAKNRMKLLARASAVADEGMLTSASNLKVVDSVKKKHVYVLGFNGDVDASQTADLRREITSVLNFADASRGDEVLVRLQTGGGTVTGYGSAAGQLLRIKDAGLKLTVCVEQVAASGGYMMACTADSIIASPFALLGSIGVVVNMPNFYNRLSREGVQYATVTAGKYKRTLSPTKKITPGDSAKLKEELEEVHELFKRFVKKHRPQVDLEQIATGEVWFDQDALDRGLCDKIRSFDDVVLDYNRQGAEILNVQYSPPPKPDTLDLLFAEGDDRRRGGLAAFLARNLFAPFLRRLLDETTTALRPARGYPRHSRDYDIGLDPSAIPRASSYDDFDDYRRDRAYDDEYDKSW